MRLKTIPLYAVLAFAACTSPNQSSNMTEDYTQYVNPFIGTDFTGNTYPGAQVPFGMVQLSPDNGLPGWDRISGYFYPDSTDCRIQPYASLGYRRGRSLRRFVHAGYASV